MLIEEDGTARLIAKGAFEEILAICATVQEGAATQPINRAEQKLRSEFEQLCAAGLRVLAVAAKPAVEHTPSPADEDGMTFMGFVTFKDPPKQDARDAIEELQAHGISTRMITGDNRFAARKVARDAGLGEGRLLTGDEIDKLDEDGLRAAVEDIRVFAEINPVQKERIVRAFRESGHTVGFLGDGINDSPALHAADVGISVDSAADVAKESASIVLLEKDLHVLLTGVELGRQTFANTRKYVFVNTSASFGNVVSMTLAPLFLPFLPLLPAQVLLLNFMSDFPYVTITTDPVDDEQIRSPGVWDMRFIERFMVVFGLASSAFDLMTFAILRFGFGADAGQFRSGWFLESLLTELAVLFVLRTERPAWRSRPSPLLALVSVAVALLGLALVATPAGDPFSFERISPPVLLAVACITLGYVAMTETIKVPFYRRVRAATAGTKPISVQPSYGVRT